MEEGADHSRLISRGGGCVDDLKFGCNLRIYTVEQDLRWEARSFILRYKTTLSVWNER
jgi:hypothetical protein